MRNRFNLPEVVALLRGLDDREPYWQRVLDHRVAGNLQAVLDEELEEAVEALRIDLRPSFTA